MIRSLAATMLDELGYRAVVCADGEQAVANSTGRPWTRAAFLRRHSRHDRAGRDGGQGGGPQIHEMDPAAVLIISTGYSVDLIRANRPIQSFRARSQTPLQYRQAG